MPHPHYYTHITTHHSHQSNPSRLITHTQRGKGRARGREREGKRERGSGRERGIGREREESGREREREREEGKESSPAKNPQKKKFPQTKKRSGMLAQTCRGTNYLSREQNFVVRPLVLFSQTKGLSLLCP